MVGVRDGTRESRDDMGFARLRLVTSAPSADGNLSRVELTNYIPGALEPLLKLEERRFTGAVRADPNGNLFMSVAPDAKRYTGHPSPEIDDQWDNLTAGMCSQILGTKTGNKKP